MDGVEGLVHISELAQHHVENPREVVTQGDQIKVKILEIDSERRRLSLSVKRVEGQALPLRSAEPPPAEPEQVSEGDLENVPELELSEDVFSGAEEGEEGSDADASDPGQGDGPAPAADEASRAGDEAGGDDSR
jgi:small subunit ribosomal protein S1